MFAIVHSDDLLERLRAGDAEAFRTLVRRHDAAMRHFARRFVSEEATADEVVQQTWLVVVDKLQTFEGRSSLKGWIFAILGNTARKRAKRDARQTVWSAFDEDDAEGSMTPDPSRFRPNGHWAEPPRRWGGNPETQTEQKQLVEWVLTEIDALDEPGSTVMRLRDVEGLDTAEVATMLDIRPGYVRVLLHRARVAVREAIEARMSEVPS